MQRVLGSGWSMRRHAASRLPAPGPVLAILRRLLKASLLLLAAASFAGCSGARLAYNNADTVVRWMADDYFALQGPQEEDFEARLARFHAWHRSEELPRYSVLMTTAVRSMTANVTRYCWSSTANR